MASAKANVNVKIDAQVKEHAAQLLERMGIDQTTAIDMFFRQIIAQRRLPFQPIVPASLDECVTSAALGKIPKVKLEADENGHTIVDKEKHPDTFDWMVNG